MWRGKTFHILGVLAVFLVLLGTRGEFLEKPDPNDKIRTILWDVLSPIAHIGGQIDQRESLWNTSDQIDPLTDDRVLSSTAVFHSGNGFDAKVDLSCTSRSDEPQHDGRNPFFRMNVSFFDSATGSGQRLKFLDQSFLGNTSGVGYVKYTMRLGERQSFCQGIPYDALEYSNSLRINLHRKRRLPMFFFDDPQCPKQIEDYGGEIGALFSTGRIVLQPVLATGMPNFVIDANEDGAKSVLDACRSWFGVTPSDQVEHSALQSIEPNGGFWNHNGSVVALDFISGGTSVNGPEMFEIRYSQPRSGMIEQGVQEGTLLIDGSIDAQGSYYGVARVFNKQCGKPLEYLVSGSAFGEHRLVLTGQRPVRRSCTLSGEKVAEELVFTVIN